MKKMKNLQVRASKALFASLIALACLCSLVFSSVAIATQNVQNGVNAVSVSSATTGYMVLQDESLICTSTKPTTGTENVDWWQIATSYTQNQLPRWCTSDKATAVKSVTMDQSATPYAPTHISYWFYGLSNLDSVTLFGDWTTPSSLDLSALIAANATFANCTSLTNLSLNFTNASQLTSASNIFDGCSNLAVLNLNLAQNIRSGQSDMFRNCSALKYFKVSTNFEFATGTGFNFAGAGSASGWQGVDEAGGGPVYTAIQEATGPAPYNAYIQAHSNSGSIIFVYDNVGPLMALNLQDTSILYCTYGAPTYVKTTQPTLTVYPIEAEYTFAKQPAWQPYIQSTTTVNFDNSLSLNGYKPTSMAWWFDKSGITTFQNATNLDVSHVTNTTAMLAHCSALTSFDSTIFTGSFTNVAASESMFEGDNQLATLNLSSFENAAVAAPAMNNMFLGTALRDVTLNTNFRFTSNSAFNFAAANPSWKAYDGASFTDMAQEGYAFWNAYLGAPHTQYHFYIEWYVPIVQVNTLEDGNQSLLFTEGFVVDTSNQFIIAATPYTSQDLPAWCQNNPEKIVYVSFDQSLQTNNYQPTSTAYWFYGLSNLASIEHLEYLDTTRVASMEAMFQGCSTLSSLNLESFETSVLTNMSHMFENCTALNNLNLASFVFDGTNTSNNMLSAFSSTNNLDNFAITSSFKFDSGTDSGFRFTATDWKARQGGDWVAVTNLNDGAAWNSFIETTFTSPGVIYFTRVNGTVGPYAQLVGNILQIQYGLIPSGASDEMPIADLYTQASLPAWNASAASIKEVLFMPSLSANNYKPTSMAYWFYGLNQLTSIYNFQNLDTSALTSINSLFEGDTALTTLDLSHFDIPATATMEKAFANLTHLNHFTVNKSFQFGANSGFEYGGYQPAFWVVNWQSKMPTTQEGWNAYITDTIGSNTFTFYTASVTVTFDANGGIFADPAVASIVYYANAGDGMPEAPTAAPREGYTATGWEDDSGESVVIPIAFPAQDTVYNVAWAPNAYIVTFDTKGGSAIEPQTVSYGGLVTQPQDPTLEGYTFDGWYADAGLSTPWDFESRIITANTTLYAGWEKNPEPAPVVTPGWTEIDGHWTYTTQEGTLAQNGWYYIGQEPKAEGWYCFDANGYLRVGGWIENASGTWSYVDESGRAYDGGWYLIGAFWYDFDGNGVMQVGWIWDPGYNSWFYCDSAGHMIQGCWYLIGNTWYGFWGNGTMCVGWIWDSSYGNWFYCDPYTGAMYQGCWAWIGNAWYGFWANGEMCYGWILDGSTWYYCDWYSGYMYTGWHWIGGNWYYFHNNGAMAYSTYIDGYWLNASGAWR